MSTHDRDDARAAHWDRIHGQKPAPEASWYEPRAALSVELITGAGVGPDASILDVGGGTSGLVDELLGRGHHRLGVLDVSGRALELVRERLGPRAERVEWFRTDVTSFRSPHPWDVWHDRAMLHFLVGEEDRRAYRKRLLEALAPDGHAVLATFGPRGPTRCSGLECRRYGIEALAEFLGPALEPEEHLVHGHRTPSGAVQEFLYARFRRS